MYKNLILNSNIKILFITSLVFVIKWYFSIYEYGLENIFLKVIFNPAGDYSYFPFVHQLSNLNLNEGYSPISEKNKLIGFPFLVIIFHAVFLKIFGLYSFIIIEFVCIFIFLKIFFLIFKELKISTNFSILLAFIFFSLLPITSFLNDLGLIYSLNLKSLYSGFYTLRFPRPLITNLFFFGFLYTSLKFFISENNNIKNKYLLLSFILLGFLFSSFFYFFLLSSFLLLILLILEYKKRIFQIDNVNRIFKYALIFLIISSLFIYQIIFIEKDYFARIGTILLTLENKIFLSHHILNGFLKKEFLVILLINIILFTLNFKHNRELKKFFLFFKIIFFSSLIIPFLYLILMSQITFFSNFVFIITLSSLLLLKINLIGILIIFIKLTYKNKFYNYIGLTIFFLLIIFNSIYFKKTTKIDILSKGIHFNSNKNSSLRKDFFELINNLEKIQNQKKLLLTNDLHTQLWWIFKGKKNFYFPYVFYVSLSDDVIEKQLFNAFKFLNLNFNDFLDYFNENKITSWRVVNTHNYFFLGHLTYQKNFLIKIKDLDEYPKKTHSFLKKKSIHHTNQVILSSNEINEFKKKFENYKLNPLLKPDLIVLFKNKMFEKNINYLENYEIFFENLNFIVLIEKI